MATNLDKPVLRESTCMVDNRNIMVCFQTDQTIRLKLKGMKSGVLTIGIGELYDYLKSKEDGVTTKNTEITAVAPKNAEPVKPSKVVNSGAVVYEQRVYDDDEPLINLHDFRSAYMVAPIPVEYKVKIEAIAVGLLAPYKKRKEERKRQRNNDE